MEIKGSTLLYLLDRLDTLVANIVFLPRRERFFLYTHEAIIWCDILASNPVIEPSLAPVIFSNTDVHIRMKASKFGFPATARCSCC